MIRHAIFFIVAVSNALGASINALQKNALATDLTTDGQILKAERSTAYPSCQGERRRTRTRRPRHPLADECLAPVRTGLGLGISTLYSARSAVVVGRHDRRCGLMRQNWYSRSLEMLQKPQRRGLLHAVGRSG